MASLAVPTGKDLQRREKYPRMARERIQMSNYPKTIMRIVFMALHLAWFGMMCFWMMHVRRNLLADPEVLIAAAAVASCSISVLCARRTLLAVGIALPYLFGMAHLTTEMVYEMNDVIAHNINPGSTYVTFGLILLSLGSWWVIIRLFSRSHSKRLIAGEKLS